MIYNIASVQYIPTKYIPIVVEAANDVNKMVWDHRVKVLLEAVESFDMVRTSSGKQFSGKDLLLLLQQWGESHLDIRGFRTWPWSKVIAYYTPGIDQIKLNTAKLNRGFSSIVGTLAHEAVHALDFNNKSIYIGHGSNKRAGKDNTAPYKVGQIFKDVAEHYERSQEK